MSRWDAGLTSYVCVSKSKKEINDGGWRVVVRDLPCMKIIRKAQGFDTHGGAMCAAILLGYPIRINAEAKYYFKDDYKLRAATYRGWGAAVSSYSVTVA